MMIPHLVSVVIPCYNHANYLTETVKSVLNSTYPSIEIIIVDDGSKDQSYEVATQLSNKYSNVFFLAQPNQGPAAARNNGINAARGQYILPVDADDKISAEYIEMAVDILQKNPAAKLVYCQAEFFGNRQGKWNLRSFSLNRLATDNMIFCSAVYRKEDWEKAGGYSDELVGGWEDWEFWISLLKTGGEVIRLDHVGFFYRIHQQSRRKSTTKAIKQETINFINKKHQAFIFSQLEGPLRINRKKSVYINRFYNITEQIKSVSMTPFNNTGGGMRLAKIPVASPASPRLRNKRAFRSVTSRALFGLLSIITYFEEWL